MLINDRLTVSEGMTITLIGYRGCGKSTVGQLLASRLGWPCVDSDDVIEQETGLTISQIFATCGESGFREKETDVLHELLKRNQTVVAAGGGAVLSERNRRMMKDAGPVVWLQASPENLAARIEQDQNSATRRPSLTGKSITDEVRDVLLQRLPCYADAATLTVDVDFGTPEEIAEGIFRELNLTRGQSAS